MELRSRCPDLRGITMAEFVERVEAGSSEMLPCTEFPLRLRLKDGTWRRDKMEAGFVNIGITPHQKCPLQGLPELHGSEHDVERLKIVRSHSSPCQTTSYAHEFSNCMYRFLAEHKDSDGACWVQCSGGPAPVFTLCSVAWKAEERTDACVRFVTSSVDVGSAAQRR